MYVQCSFHTDTLITALVWGCSNSQRNTSQSDKYTKQQQHTVRLLKRKKSVMASHYRQAFGVTCHFVTKGTTMALSIISRIYLYAFYTP